MLLSYPPRKSAGMSLLHRLSLGALAVCRCLAPVRMITTAKLTIRNTAMITLAIVRRQKRSAVDTSRFSHCSNKQQQHRAS